MSITRKRWKMRELHDGARFRHLCSIASQELMGKDYQHQIEWKRKQAESELLAFFGRLNKKNAKYKLPSEDNPISPPIHVIPSNKVDYYRNKTCFTISSRGCGDKGGEMLRIGFAKKKTREMKEGESDVEEQMEGNRLVS